MKIPTLIITRAFRHGILCLAFQGMLAVPGTASADVVTLSLSDFVVFSGSGTEIAGHSLVYGDIGSNLDLSMVGNSQIIGSVYVGGSLDAGSNIAFGSNGITAGPDVQQPGPQPLIYPTLLSNIVVNGSADFGGSANAALATRIYGNVYTDDVFLRTNVAIRTAGALGGGNLEYTGTFDRNSGASIEGLVNGVGWGPAITSTNPPAPAPLASTKTFGTIAMTSGISFTATGANQVVGGSNFLDLLPGPSNTYGSLSTSQTGQTVRLSSGDYFFNSIAAQGNFTLEIDLSSGQPINIYVVGDAVFGQDTVLKVKGAGTDGGFVPISQAPQLASLINWTLGGTFDLGGGDADSWTTIFGGIVYSAFYDGLLGEDGIVIDQHVDWYGALYAYDTVNLADHSRFSYLTATAVPEPTSLMLLAGGLLLALALRRRRAERSHH